MRVRAKGNVVAVTHNTKMIGGVTGIEIYEAVCTDGDLRNDTLDWFSQDDAGTGRIGMRPGRTLGGAERFGGGAPCVLTHRF